MSSKTASVIIGEPDRALLIALNRFQYLTAAQASRLLYPNLKDNNRYASRRLKRLVDSGFVLRLRDLPKPMYGSPPHVFTLARKGRKYLELLGMETQSYYRPSAEGVKAWNRLYMQHTLEAIDVLIEADMLCRIDPAISCPRLLCERELKRKVVRVEVPPVPGIESAGPRRAAVIPDGWFEVQVGSGAPHAIALELDRGTEEQKFFRRKVAALVTWANGPYREMFATDNITIAVVTPTVSRRDQLRLWTSRELTVRGWTEDEEIFLFTSSDPVQTSPHAFFFDQLWYQTQSELPPLALLDSPEDTRGEASAAYV